MRERPKCGRHAESSRHPDSSKDQLSPAACRGPLAPPRTWSASQLAKAKTTRLEGGGRGGPLRSGRGLNAAVDGLAADLARPNATLLSCALFVDPLLYLIILLFVPEFIGQTVKHETRAGTDC